MEDLIMSDVKEVQGVEHTVRIEEPKEKFGKKVKRKTLNFLAKNGAWIGAATGGLAVGYLAGKHKTKKSVVVKQEVLEAPQAVLEAPQEYYQQEVDEYTEVQDLEDFGQEEYTSESVE
jgi:hypothetical protein